MPDPTPAWAVVLHAAGGGAALLAGAAALVFRKGERAHRAAGKVFVIAMLAMGASGAYLAVWKPERISVVSGLLTAYLVATAWVTVRRKPGTIGLFEPAALLVALAAAVADLTFGVQAGSRATGLLDGFPPEPHFGFAGLAALAAALDLSVILRGGLSGAQRIARHVWRMCVALLIAAISFFLGQQDVFPEAVRGSPALFAPVLAVLGLMVFWLARVYVSNAFKPAGRAGQACSD